jgi:hypothetical protein
MHGASPRRVTILPMAQTKAGLRKSFIAPFRTNKQLCQDVEPNRLPCRHYRCIFARGISQRRHRPCPADGRSRPAKFGSASRPRRRSYRSASVDNKRLANDVWAWPLEPGATALADAVGDMSWDLGQRESDGRFGDRIRICRPWHRPDSLRSFWFVECARPTCAGSGRVVAGRFCRRRNGIHCRRYRCLQYRRCHIFRR